MSKSCLNDDSSLAELVAVLLAVTDGTPRVLTSNQANLLPIGTLSPVQRSLQAGVRAWVATQQLTMGYVEQLYTFVDTSRRNRLDQPVLYVSYLGLLCESPQGIQNTSWHDWYSYFPWEDHRQGYPKIITERIVPALLSWVGNTSDTDLMAKRLRRVQLCWGLADFVWNDEYALQRYELLYEAKLIVEAGAIDAKTAIFGCAMQQDHRRVLVSAITRLRGKIKYRPVVFELMAAEFTLLQLQLCIEALAGVLVHKQNFRRLVANLNLIEPTGSSIVHDRGRPAQLYRFKANVLLEYSMSSGRLPIVK